MQRPGRWTWVHLASLVGILSALVVLSRGQWFFGDEWDFLLFRGVAHPAVGVFYPHNEHWSTLPILWYRAVFQVFALRSYWPYLLSLFAIHLAVVHLLWRCVIRAGVPASIATVGAAAFGLFGAGSENLLWAFQIGFVGSLAAGLGLGLAVNGPPERRRVALVSAGAIVSLMISGISVVMVGYVGLVALRRWGWRLAVIATAPAALVYVAWLKWQGDAGLDGATRPFHGGVRDIPRFAFGGISATLGAPVQSVRFGEVAFWVLVGFVVINGRRWWRSAPECLALAACAPLMLAVISQGRAALGQPNASRYLYLVGAMLLPLVAMSAWTIASRVPRADFAVAAVAGIFTVSGAAQLHTVAVAERGRELALKGQFLASVELKRSGAPIISDTPDFLYAKTVSVEQLDAVVRRHELPMVPLYPRDRAAAELAMQVAVGAGEHKSGRASAAVPADVVLTAVDTGCVTADFRGLNIEIHEPVPTSFSVETQVESTGLLFVPFPGGNAGGRQVDFVPRKPVTIRMAVPGVLVLRLPAGSSRVCGIRWRR